MATERVVVPKVRADRRTELTNVVCPKCDGPISFTPKRWLFCANCSATPKLGTKAAEGGPDKPYFHITRDNLDAANRYLAAAREFIAAMKRDAEVRRLLRSAPPEFVADLERDHKRARRAVERTCAKVTRLRIAAFGPYPDEGA